MSVIDTERKQGIGGTEETEEQPTKENGNKNVFKKPVLIGKIGKLPKKIQNTNTASPQSETSDELESRKVYFEETKEQNDTEDKKEEDKPAADSSAMFSYKEPIWSGLPESVGTSYQFDVLKDGSIKETIDLTGKPFWVFGRLPNCDILMQHPTISRYHAVLQYRSTPTETDTPGFYIYDLGSTHGTFLNKNRLRPKVYVKVHVGHMLKLGCSSRMYILNGPEEDTEAESELSVTELKAKRAEEIRLKEEEEARILQEIEEKRKKEEEKGVDWGMGEDADEETDLSENPFAQTTNEELYLDDPKKALRGFFEREGVELEYDCNEQGIGQFLCKVELPIDDEFGRPIVAEVLHKGKKKESVIQCALEACRIIDRHGLLRQAVHESRKRKGKNWEENDYYDSDEDTFLDRTGTIEKKREKRMQAKLPQKVETYDSLVEKEKEICRKIDEIETKLIEAQRKYEEARTNAEEGDSLDSFMEQLKDSKPDKQTITKLKTELSKLKQEHANVVRLVNITKPASLPPLIPQEASGSNNSNAAAKNKMLPIFGKRRKTKIQLPSRPPPELLATSNSMDVDEEEEDEEEDEGKKEVKSENVKKQKVENKIEAKSSTKMRTEECQGEHSKSSLTVPSSSEGHKQSESIAGNQNTDTSSATIVSSTQEESIPSSSASSSDDGEDGNTYQERHMLTFRKFEHILNSKNIPPFPEKHHDKLQKILNSLKRLATNEDRMHVDWKRLVAKKRKVMKLISDMKHSDEPDEKMEHRVSTELKRILNELNSMMEQKCKVIHKVQKMGDEIKSITEEVNKKYPEHNTDSGAEGSSNCDSSSSSCPGNAGSKVKTPGEKKEVKSEQRQQSANRAPQTGYDEISSTEDYSMWVPPANQSGDGRTSLNEKYGY